MLAHPAIAWPTFRGGLYAAGRIGGKRVTGRVSGLDAYKVPKGDGQDFGKRTFNDAVEK